MTVDRQAIVHNVYNDTVAPLWSMVPSALSGHVDAFKDLYGDAPDIPGATKTLKDAGITTPVPLEIWWTPTHYGDSSADEYAEIKRSLEASGLFTVTLKSTEWDTYITAALTDQYPQYQLGWFPDYPDCGQLRLHVLLEELVPERPLLEPADREAARRRAGLDRPGPAGQGLRGDPEDRRAGRAGRPDLGGNAAGRRAARA